MSEAAEKKAKSKSKSKNKGKGKKKGKSKGKKKAKVVKMDPTVLELDPSDIKKGWRARQDYGDITELAESISDIGQMQPVVVKPSKEDGKYVIIAGLRRTRACKQLGIKVRAVVIKPTDELHNLTMQLAENIKRKGFDKLEVADGLKRYRAKYEAAHPETKLGGAGKGRGKGEDGAERFTLEAAKVLSISEQGVRDLLKIADLPAKKKKEIEESATTTKQRNVAARKALSEVRRQEKEARQKAEAEEKHAKRKAAEKKGKKTPKTISLIHGKQEKQVKHKEIKTHLKGKIDLILTDPPYDRERSAIKYGGDREDINSGNFDWDKLDASWVLDWSKLMAKNSTLIAFCPIEAVGVYEAMIKAAGLTYKGALIWHKTNPGVLNREGVYLSSCEAIVFATKGKPFFKPFKNKGAKLVHNCFDGPICQGDERVGHKTQKPLWLIERLLKRHSQRKDLVVDPFMGVGTTAVACKTLKRACVGIEKIEKFVKRASLRLKAL